MTIPTSIIVQTLRGYPSQMKENLMISDSKLMSDNKLIW